MKNLPALFFLVILLVGAFVGCSEKENTPEPIAPAKMVAGKFQVTYYREGNQEITLPTVNGLSGEVHANFMDSRHIALILVLKDKDEFEQTDLGPFQLDEVAGKAKIYSLVHDRTNYGTISPSELTFKDTSPDGTVTEIRATR